MKSLDQQPSGRGTHHINNSITERYNLYYWRERNEEVDFVIQRNNKIVALEVKSGRRGESRGIATFSGLYHSHKSLIITNNLNKKI